jgi:hypothetical protein
VHPKLCSTGSVAPIAAGPAGIEILREVVKLVAAYAWPVALTLLLLLFRKELRSLLSSLVKRVEAGHALKTTWFSIDAPPVSLKAPASGELVKAEHLALVHSSWRYAKKDREFRKNMYAFHAVIQGTDEVLDRVEYVKYRLNSSYPNPVQTSTERRSKFKLKELAWGESHLHAEVKIRDQEEPILLSRYINLTETGPAL